MKTENIWILGHKLTNHDSSGDFDLNVFESAPGVPGPPPHTHSKYQELFLVLEGSMEFMVNGDQKILKAGESIDLLPGTIHTFKNAGNDVCKYVNIHSPKGFMKFFRDMGVNADLEDAASKSVAPEIINKVIETAGDYDMTLYLPKQ